MDYLYKYQQILSRMTTNHQETTTPHLSGKENVIGETDGHHSDSNLFTQHWQDTEEECQEQPWPLCGFVQGNAREDVG